MVTTTHRLFKSTLSIAAFLPLGLSFCAQAEQHQHAHEHGIAEMNLVVADGNILVEFQSPAYNVFGFEHKPHDETQVQKMHQQVHAIKTGALLQPSLAAQCQFELAAMHNPFATENPAHGDEHKKYTERHEHEQHDDHDAEHSSQHKNIHFEYAYHCQKPEQLQHLDASALFKAWPQLHKVRVQQIIGNQQSASELTQSKTLLPIQ